MTIKNIIDAEYGECIRVHDDKGIVGYTRASELRDGTVLFEHTYPHVGEMCVDVNIGDAISVMSGMYVAATFNGRMWIRKPFPLEEDEITQKWSDMCEAWENRRYEARSGNVTL